MGRLATITLTCSSCKTKFRVTIEVEAVHYGREGHEPEPVVRVEKCPNCGKPNQFKA
jgi:hypothetical protein